MSLRSSAAKHLIWDKRFSSDRVLADKFAEALLFILPAYHGKMAPSQTRQDSLRQ